MVIGRACGGLSGLALLTLCTPSVPSGWGCHQKQVPSPLPPDLTLQAPEGKDEGKDEGVFQLLATP